MTIGHILPIIIYIYIYRYIHICILYTNASTVNIRVRFFFFLQQFNIGQHDVVIVASIVDVIERQPTILIGQLSWVSPKKLTTHHTSMLCNVCMSLNYQWSRLVVHQFICTSKYFHYDYTNRWLVMMIGGPHSHQIVYSLLCSALLWTKLLTKLSELSANI